MVTGVGVLPPRGRRVREARKAPMINGAWVESADGHGGGLAPVEGRPREGRAGGADGRWGCEEVGHDQVVLFGANCTVWAAARAVADASERGAWSLSRQKQLYELISILRRATRAVLGIRAPLVAHAGASVRGELRCASRLCGLRSCGLSG